MFEDGVWRAPQVSAVSYPADANALCLQVEASSYWFAHRNRCILAAMTQHPPHGMIYDIGGGNGFVALALQQAGLDVALVEPGPGARFAAARGVDRVIQASLGDAGFAPGALPAVAAFDVIEHIEDDHGFLNDLRHMVEPGGRLYCTVPAIGALWSDEDVHAGHFRRYSVGSLGETLRRCGWQVELLSPFFSWLTLPVFLLRALPFRLRGSRAGSPPTRSMQADHHLPAGLVPMVSRVHAWELARLTAGRTIPTGTSLLCVARRS